MECETKATDEGKNQENTKKKYMIKLLGAICETKFIS